MSLAKPKLDQVGMLKNADPQLYEDSCEYPQIKKELLGVMAYGIPIWFQAKPNKPEPGSSISQVYASFMILCNSGLIFLTIQGNPATRNLWKAEFFLLAL